MKISDLIRISDFNYDNNSFRILFQSCIQREFLHKLAEIPGWSFHDYRVEGNACCVHEGGKLCISSVSHPALSYSDGLHVFYTRGDSISRDNRSIPCSFEEYNMFSSVLVDTCGLLEF